MGEEKKRVLLFISKYPQIIQEFIDALGDKEVEIDTATNGIEAAAKIKKKEYQVVVTGLSLEGYNGEQIITYLNKNAPKTVCIIYTTTISPAQLHFFINERNVFRVFLRPVDFRKVFWEALEEAFEYHDVQVKNAEEAISRKDEQERQREEIVAIDQRMRLQSRAKNSMKRYMRRLMELSLKEYAAQKLDKEQIQHIEAMEETVTDYCCEQGEQVKEALTKAEELLKDIQKLTGEYVRG